MIVARPGLPQFRFPGLRARFGGVELCDDCRHKWRTYLTDFPEEQPE